MINTYKYKHSAPYTLHDPKINKIENIDDSLKIYFENGYISSTEPYQQVNGNISIEEVDYDFCYAYILSDNGNLGKFTGKKITLLDFIKEYTKFSFEVVEESYGYNSVVYNGYLILPGKDNFIELTLTIYHFGNIIYETDQ
jgi:hypothetical protein